MNSTNDECPMNVPGLWHNGDCSLLCRPAEWYDILVFVLGNYLAHVATVVSPPGVSTVDQVLNLIEALIFPLSGLGLGLEAIFSWAIFATTPLRTAARAGALLMVVKTNQAEEDATELSDTRKIDTEVIQDRSAEDQVNVEQNTIAAPPKQRTIRYPQKHIHPRHLWKDFKVHGSFCLPEGFQLRRVPYYTEFEEDEEESRSKRKDNNMTSKWYDFLCIFSKRYKTTNEVACSYNGAKAIVSIVQILFGIHTLYRTRGNQVEQFGYAAYGLTVIQYALMSFVNLLGNIVRPDYASTYIVGSNCSDDLQEKHNCALVTIGRIKEHSYQVEKHEARKSNLMTVCALSIYPGIGIHMLVVGLMTNFTKGQSTLAQRVWIMCWLVFGAFYGISVIMVRQIPFDTTRDIPRSISSDSIQPTETDPTNATDELGRNLSIENDEEGYTNFARAVLILTVGAPTIGGFVVVAQMIKQYGVCSKILDVHV